MSWNIATRLNNLQYQISSKAGNPLTTDLDCDNNSIIDCKTLHYQFLDPPAGGGSVGNLQQVLNTGDDANGENIQNVGTISVAQQNYQDTDLVNQDVVISQLSGLGNRLNVYMASDTVSPFSSSAILATGVLQTTSNIVCNGTASVAGGLAVGSAQVPSNLTLDGNLIINEDGAPSGSTTLSATSANLLSVSGGITTTGNITCSQLNYNTLNPPISPGGIGTLSQVLTAGNDATTQKITNLGTPTLSTDASTKGYVDNSLAVSQQIIKLYYQGGQTVPDGVPWTLNWTGQSYLNDTFSSPSSYTINTSGALAGVQVNYNGFYEITGSVCWDVNPSGTRLMVINIGQPTPGYRDSIRSYATEFAGVNLTQAKTFYAELFANDVVQLQVEQTSGGDLDVLSWDVPRPNVGTSTFLYIRRLL